MLKVKVVAVGKLKERYLRDGCNEYLRRLQAYAQVEVVEVKEEIGPESVTREMQRVAAHVPDQSHLVVLDMMGKQMDSLSLSSYLEKVAIQGQSSVCFVIGGADGVSDEIRKRADLVFSFSALTFPHQLFRLMLLEQIYRAFTIQRREPYHCGH